MLVLASFVSAVQVLRPALGNPAWFHRERFVLLPETARRDLHDAEPHLGLKAHCPVSCSFLLVSLCIVYVLLKGHPFEQISYGQCLLKGLALR